MKKLEHEKFPHSLFNLFKREKIVGFFKKVYCFLRHSFLNNLIYLVRNKNKGEFENGRYHFN
jgi:hypothetical protein